MAKRSRNGDEVDGATSFALIPGRRLTHKQREALAQRHANDPATLKALRESRAVHGQPLEVVKPRGVQGQCRRRGAGRR
jgi:hypothetical protein